MATMWRVKGLLCVVMETVTGICVFCVLEELEGGVKKAGQVLVVRGFRRGCSWERRSRCLQGLGVTCTWEIRSFMTCFWFLLCC